MVAILTGPATGNGSAMPWMDDAQWSATLEALAKPPQDLTSLKFVFKSHPRFDISSLLEKVAIAPNLKVLPVGAPVTKLMDNAWVVVVCNHYGSVVAEAVMSGKPIIFLDSARLCYPYIEKYGFAAGEVVEDIDTFWKVLMQLQSSPEFYYKLAERCQSFRFEISTAIESYACRASQGLGK